MNGEREGGDMNKRVREELIKEMWYINSVEYYSAIKKKKIMPFASTWMDLGGIMLSEVSQTKTNTL